MYIVRSNILSITTIARNITLRVLYLQFSSTQDTSRWYWHMMTRISTYAYLTNYRQQTYTQTTIKRALYNFLEYSRKNFDSQRSWVKHSTSSIECFWPIKSWLLSSSIDINFDWSKTFILSILLQVRWDKWCVIDFYEMNWLDKEKINFIASIKIIIELCLNYE